VDVKSVKCGEILRTSAADVIDSDKLTYLDSFGVRVKFRVKSSLGWGQGQG